MDSILIKYSEFFDNDGGFEKVRSDFKQLGDFLVKEAEKIKKETQIFDLSEIERIAELEARTEKLTKTFREFNDAKKQVEKLEEKMGKTQRNNIKLTNQQSKSLDELNVELAQHRAALKVINAAEKAGEISTTKAAEARGRLRLETKNLTQEINKQEKEILNQNKLTAKEIKLQKAQIVLEKERAETIEEIRERLSALRLVASQVNITTQEGRDRVQEYNDEINELTDTLSENSDKFIQNKINVGNYEESVVNALEKTGLMNSGIGVLDSSLNSLVKILTLNKEELAAMEESLKKNSSAIKRFAVSFGKLNKVLKASIIGAVLIAVASIGSVFSQGRAGVIKTEKALTTFNNVLRVVINTLADLFNGGLSVFNALRENVSNVVLPFKILRLEAKLLFAELKDSFGGNADEVNRLKTEIAALNKELADGRKNAQDGVREGWEEITTAIGSFSSRYKDAQNAITAGNKAISESFKIADEIRAAEIELIKLRGELALLESAGGDSTKSLNEQLEATEKALVKNLEVIEQENEVRRLNLKLANAKARQDVLAAGSSLKALGVDAQRLANLKSEEEFARELLRINQAIDPSKNPLSDDLLDESQGALRDFLEGLNEQDQAVEESAKARREIQRDLFEQNLDLLIDFIDTEKNLSEQQVNDVTKNFRDRLVEADRFNKKFRENAQAELNEFSKIAKEFEKDLDFDIDFNEDGTFDVLVNDTKLSIDNVVELNKQIQGLGLPEIVINRFREFIVEARNGVKDFNDINKELGQTGILVKELVSNLSVDEDELAALENLNNRFNELFKIDQSQLSDAERTKILSELEDLEKQKTAIVKFAEEQRRDNRLEAIEAELATVEQGSKRELELLREQAALRKEIFEDSIDSNAEKLKSDNEKAKAEYKKFTEEVREILGTILDKVVEVGQKRVEEQEERVDKADEAISKQEERAQQGLSNTLAFEQRERGKAEAELVKQQKRLERLERIKGLYSSYASYASQGEGDNAIAKALRDFAILESIAASFGDGGLVADKVPTDGRGIIRGRSHNGQHGGIPVMVEGNEGFFSKKAVDNIGKDNFRAFHDMATRGVLGKNFFTGQGESFSKVMPVPYAAQDNRLINEVRELNHTIKSKSESFTDVPKIVDGVLTFVETVKKGNVTKRNHYVIKKRGL